MKIINNKTLTTHINKCTSLTKRTRYTYINVYSPWLPSQISPVLPVAGYPIRSMIIQTQFTSRLPFHLLVRKIRKVESWVSEFTHPLVWISQRWVSFLTFLMKIYDLNFCIKLKRSFSSKNLLIWMKPYTNFRDKLMVANDQDVIYRSLELLLQACITANEKGTVASSYATALSTIMWIRYAPV